MIEDKKRDNLVMQLLPLIEQFLAGIPRAQEQSYQRYRKIFLSFVTYLDRSLARKSFPIIINQKTIICWLNEMRTHYSLSTLVRQAQTVARFLSFLEKKEYLEGNPMARLQKQYPMKGLKGIILALMKPSPQKSLKNLESTPKFASFLGHQMQKFIALGRSQGKIYSLEEQVLCRFDRFLRSYSPSSSRLSDSILKKWVSLFSRSHYRNFMIVRLFCLYLRRFDSKSYVPDVSLLPSPPPPFHPHIYSRVEIVTLLKAARQLKPSAWSPLRPQMFYVLISLLYTTGMRLGEVLKLRLSNIDWKSETLYIRETKFFKSRLVPLSPSMMKELKDYLQLRRRAGMPTNPESLVFQNPYRKEPYSDESIDLQFRHLLQRLGLKPASGRSGPRIHDLRHTFAIHRLEDWYRKGEDVQVNLGLLSTYLGHIGLASTQRYLSMTTELLQQASQRFNQYFTSTKNIKGKMK